MSPDDAIRIPSQPEFPVMRAELAALFAAMLLLLLASEKLLAAKAALGALGAG